MRETLAASNRLPAPPEAATLPPAVTRRLWLAYLSGAFGLAATAQINFLVPLRARELGASFEVIGLLVGAGAVAPSLLAVTTGAAIDRLGPQRTFVIGTAATAILAALFVFVTNYWWFLLLQPLLGVTRNLGWLASQSYITGIGRIDQRHALAGRFAFFTNGGQMVAPLVIGGVAQLVGFRYAFLFLAAYAAAFAAIGLLLPPAGGGDGAARDANHGIGVRAALQMLALRPMQAVLLLSGMRLWVMWIYTAFVPAYLIDQGLQAATVGTVLATYGTVATLTAPTAGFWTRFASGPTVVAVGLGGGAVALLLAPHFVTVPLVYLAPALIGIGHGVSLPLILTIVAHAAPPGKRGIALGLRGAVNQGTAAAGPIIVGTLISGAGLSIGFTVAATVGVAMVSAARILHGSAPKVQDHL